MGHLEEAGKKIFDVLDPGEQIYIFRSLGNEIGWRKAGCSPHLGALDMLCIGEYQFVLLHMRHLLWYDSLPYIRYV